MTLRSGLAGSIGYGDETTWGVPVAPTLHIPLVDESIGAEIERVESEGIIAGQRVIRSQQWEPGNVDAGGDVGHELYDRDLGLLLKHMFGGSTTTGPFVPADLSGLGLTAQVGVPNVTDGTVHPKTLAGGKVASWEIAANAGEIATLGLSLVGKHLVNHRSVVDGVTTSGDATITSATAAFTIDDVGKPISGTGIPAAATILSWTSATEVELSANASASGTGVTFTIGMALTSPSYTSGIAPMKFVSSSVSIGGVAYKTKSVSLSGDNGLDTGRFFGGQRWRDEPLEADLRRYEGTIDSEFFGTAAYNRFVGGAEAAVVLAFARGSRSLTFTLNVRFDGTTPQVEGRGIVQQSLPFVVVGTTTDALGISAALV